MTSVFQTFALSPMDTLFFREARPFGVEETVDVKSVFPPYPQTLQGLVRSRILAKGCGRWDTYGRGCRDKQGQPCTEEAAGCGAQKVSGTLTGNNGTLQIRGPWLRVGDQHLLPSPLDLIARSTSLKPDVWGQPFGTQILAPAGQNSSGSFPGKLEPLGPPAAWHHEKFEGVAGWMTWPAYAAYLTGKPPDLMRGGNWWRSSDLILEERRPGLAMEQGRNRAKEHHLYFAHHTRLASRGHGPAGLAENVSVAFEATGLNGFGAVLTKFPALPFGGERRVVRIEQLAAPSPWAAAPADVRGAIEKSGRCKLVLLQPAWFEGGWHPGGWDAAQGRAVVGNEPVTWRAARVERPERLAGWDLARGDQKPMRLFVPRGSVFYVEIGEADVSAVLAAWGSCLSATPKDEAIRFASFGLGHALLGAW